MIIDYNGKILAYEEYNEAILTINLDKKAQIEHRKKFSFLASQDRFTLHLE
jgi:omega-amidase